MNHSRQLPHVHHKGHLRVSVLLAVVIHNVVTDSWQRASPTRNSCWIKVPFYLMRREWGWFLNVFVVQSCHFTKTGGIIVTPNTVATC